MINKRIAFIAFIIQQRLQEIISRWLNGNEIRLFGLFTVTVYLLAFLEERKKAFPLSCVSIYEAVIMSETEHWFKSSLLSVLQIKMNRALQQTQLRTK